MSYKLDKVVEMCQEFTEDEDDPRHRSSAWTQFRAVPAAIQSRLDAVGVPTFVLNGDVKQEDRMEIVVKLVKDQGHGGTGRAVDDGPDAVEWD